jgi:hypothetical protein
VKISSFGKRSSDRHDERSDSLSSFSFEEVFSEQ